VGNAAYHRGHLTLAAAAYEKGLDLDPDRPGVRLPYGHLLRDLGRLDESERQLRIAVEQTTADDDRTRISLAETLTALGKTSEAEPLIDAVLARSPTHVEALLAKGRALAAQGKGGEAVRYLEKAAEGSSADPWIELARLHIGLGQADAALRAVDTLFARNPSHPWALALRGHALILAGRRDEGIAALGRAIAAQPRRPEAWLSLAQAFEAAGERAKARQCRRAAESVRRG
jgi:predicted Zn-dependent protease